MVNVVYFNHDYELIYSIATYFNEPQFSHWMQLCCCTGMNVFGQNAFFLLTYERLSSKFNSRANAFNLH